MTIESSSAADPSASAVTEYAAFGEVEVVPLSCIQKIAAVNLVRSYSTTPHVTQHNEADVTELEAARKKLKAENKISQLSFVIKAVMAALQTHPKFKCVAGCWRRESHHQEVSQY